MNNDINTIVITGEKAKQIGPILEVKDYQDLKNILKDINKENIKTIKITSKDTKEIDYELLKEFKNIENFEFNPQNDIFNEEEIESYLDLNTLYNLYETYPNLKEISFDKADEKIIEIYDKLNLTLKIKKAEKIETNNQFLEYKNKYEAMKLQNIIINDKTKIEEIEELTKYCKTINKIIFETDKIEKTKEIYDLLIKNNIKINKISCTLKNKNYSNSDIEKLREINKTSEVNIIYNENYNNASLEDFINMREALNYYTSVINENNLSQVEKIMYAYDIVKTFEYKENKENSLSPREISSIIKTGDIVCVGYSELLNQILKELGIKASKCSIYVNQLEYGEPEVQLHNITTPNHECSLIKIDDDKYNIHGIYFFDTTTDRTTENLDNYNTFAISMLEYKERYIDKADASYPNLFSYGLKKYKNNDILNEDELKRQLNIFFGKEVNQDELSRYLYADSITSRQLEEILINVRLAQGYSEEILDEEIQKLPKNIDNKPKFNIQ